MSVRILIVDDHAVVRTGLRLLLDAAGDLETVAEAGTARDAVFEARKHKPDVILMDVVLPDRTGIEATPGRPQGGPRGEGAPCSRWRTDPSYWCARRSRPGPPATSSRRPPTTSS